MNEARQALLQVTNLRISLPTGADRSHALHDLTLTVRAGECVCVVGESGSGKSMLANTILGLLPPGVQVASGQLLFDGEDLSSLSREQMRQLRGRRISMVFQEPMSALNPLLSVGRQIEEVLLDHGVRQKQRRCARVIELLTYVGLPEPERVYRAYPHQLSGGQRQRVVIAMALAFDPQLLIADEPTSALDVTTQAQIIRLLRRIQQEKGMAMLFITHDFSVVQAVADRVLVLEKGHQVEEGSAYTVLNCPQAPYTRKLVAAAMPVAVQPRSLPSDALEWLAAEKISHGFRRSQRWGRRRTVQALDEVDLQLHEGETLGIVGESGSGKSTLGRALIRLLRPDSGQVRWFGEEVANLPEKHLRSRRREVQMIFQDPFASLNPRQRVGQILMSGPLAHGASEEQARSMAFSVLDRVGLPPTAFDRYPQAFSGGQRQRIGIARALALQPRVLIADECVSALDALIQMQILELLEDLQRQLKLSLVFITHDLHVAARLCDRIAVMRQGRVLEVGSTQDVFTRPTHVYTRSLLEAMPSAPIERHQVCPETLP